MVYIFKNLLYKLIFVKNKIKYRNKKIKIHLLEVWIGQTCTLKCRDCLHMIPYIRPEIYNVDVLIKDINNMLEMSEVEYISVVGGEPFTNREIYKLIDYINSDGRIKKGKIITNGTLKLGEPVINSLKNDKNVMEIHIDVYPGQDNKCAEFAEVLKKNKIPYEKYRYDEKKDMRWKYLCENNMKLQNVSKAKKAHRRCWMKSVFTISNRKFASCPRGITTKYVYEFKDNPYELVNLTKIKPDNIGKAYIATCMEGIWKDYCRYCPGVTVENNEDVIPGIQIK